MDRSFKIIYLFLLALVITLSSLYLFQIINYTQESYLAQAHQNEVKSVSRNSLSAPSVLSLSEVENIARDLDFVETKQVGYIEVYTGSKVVAR